MFLLVVCYVSFSEQIVAQSREINMKIELPSNELNIGQVIDILKKDYQLLFSYNPHDIDVDKILTLPSKTIILKYLLDKIIEGSNLKYRLKDRQIVFYKNIQYTINGFVTDENSQEALINAYVYIPSLKVGAITNNYGFYSLQLPAGKYVAEITYIGFASKSLEIQLENNIRKDISLKEILLEINEVQVVSDLGTINSNRLGLHKMNAAELKSVPGMMGEHDAFKSIQQLPGIVPITDGVSNFSVRGGSFDQNLILIDEAPVFNPAHTVGFFSTINPDAIQSINIYKGDIPAKYGGKISSVIDVHTKEGNRNRFSGNGGIGPFSSRLSLETPIGKKISAFASGRYSYSGLVLKSTEVITEHFAIPQLNNFPRGNEININFYDIHAKVNYQLNDRNRMYITTYTSKDNFYFAQLNDKTRYKWGNTTTTARWNYIAGEKLFINSSLIYSNYTYKNLVANGAYNYIWESHVTQIQAKSDADYYINTRNKASFGVSYSIINCLPGEINPVDTSSIISPMKLNERTLHETAIYLDNNQKVGERLSIQYGIRAVLYHSVYSTNTDSLGISENMDKSFFSPEPRISVKYKLTGQQNIKIAYTRITQPMQSLNNTLVGLPTDVNIPFNKSIKPQIANQVSIGYELNTFADIRFGSEVYYKKMDNVIDFIDNTNLFMNKMIDNQIKSGSGEAYGIESILNKNKGKFKGMISYTWSKTQRTINGINNNKPYPVAFDYRHVFNTNLSYELGKCFRFSAVFMYRTGGAITMPESIYYYYGRSTMHYTEKNGYRLPVNHRLDLAINFHGPNYYNKRWKGILEIGIYNVYGRRNVLGAYITSAYTDDGMKLALRKIYMFGSLPYISYNFTF